MTKRNGGLMLALAVAVGLGTTPLQAQRGAGLRGQAAGLRGQAAGPNAGRSLDILLENQERLGLSEDQLAQIQQLKVTVDEEVDPLVEQMRVLREKIRSGEVDGNEGARELQALRGRLTTATAPLRGRIQEILTVEQHQNLQAVVREGRPGRGQALGFQGQGMRRAPRGQLRGGRGGIGPRKGYYRQGRTPALGFRNRSPGGGPLHRWRRAPAPRGFFRRGGDEGFPGESPGVDGLYPLG